MARGRSRKRPSLTFAKHSTAGSQSSAYHGSHHIMRHPDGRRTTVPVHAGRDIRPGTLRNILRDTGLTVDEFRRLL
jgi:predicted RNA binding protein YcfA (HicA-like mRNA interferase family)